MCSGHVSPVNMLVLFPRSVSEGASSAEQLFATQHGYISADISWCALVRRDRSLHIPNVLITHSAFVTPTHMCARVVHNVYYIYYFVKRARCSMVSARRVRIQVAARARRTADGLFKPSRRSRVCWSLPRRCWVPRLGARRRPVPGFHGNRKLQHNLNNGRPMSCMPG